MAFRVGDLVSYGGKNLYLIEVGAGGSNQHGWAYCGYKDGNTSGTEWLPLTALIDNPLIPEEEAAELRRWWGRVETEPDLVNQPPHYTSGGIETIDFIEAKGLGYHLGNVVKYVTRAGKKGPAKMDLQKARWYLDRAIEHSEEA